MVENTQPTAVVSSTVISDKTPDKPRVRKSKSGDRREKIGGNGSQNSVDWSGAEDDIDFDSDGEWEVEEDPGEESPSTWDPKELEEQTSSIGAWKDNDEPNRVQDLPSPSLVEASDEERKSTTDEEEWPFKGACAFEDKIRRRRFAKSNQSVSSDMSSVGSVPKQRNGPKELSANQVASGCDEGNVHEADDIDDGEDTERIQAWKMRESWKGSSHHTQNSDNTSSSGRLKNRGEEPSGAGRSANRPDADDDGVYHLQTKPQPHADSMTVAGNEDIDDDHLDQDADDSRPTKPRRSAARRGSESGGGELGGGSFHGLRKDPDKPRSSSGGRRTPTGGRARTPTGGRPNRRRVKDKSLDYSSHPPEDEDEDFSEDIQETSQLKLKGDDDDTPGRKSAWKERRKSRERVLSDDCAGDFETRLTTIEAPRSTGRRPPPSRRTQLNRASSERWNRAVEGVDDRGSDEPQSIKTRAHESLNRANDELSKSAHTLRRHHSGGAFMAGNLDRRSHHGGAELGRRTPTDGRRRPSRNYDSVDSAGSFGGESYESFDRSTHSQRTLESIEDFEDFGRIDFQTPGMVAFDEELLDLMQRANPEVTAHLDQRVHRKRDMVMYDQNMPMMTRRALLTRQASAQVSRQYVDGSSIDRKRLLLRSDSMSSVNSHDDLTLSNHRSLRGTPGRRAPPRTKSSGLGAVVRNDYIVPGAGPSRPSDSDDRRRVFRTRSGTGTNSFRQHPNKPNRIQSLSRRPASGDQIEPQSTRGAQIEPHSMRGATSSGDAMISRRPLQRAKSTTSLKGTNSIDRVASQKPARRMPKKDRDEVPDLKSTSSDEGAFEDFSVDYESEDSDVVSDIESRTPSPKKPLRRKPTKAPTKEVPLKSKSAPTASTKKASKSTDKKDMANRRNRQKLHLLMYEAKMGVDMKDLFKQVRDGEMPRSPIKTLMMPSP